MKIHHFSLVILLLVIFVSFNSCATTTTAKPTSNHAAKFYNPDESKNSFWTKTQLRRNIRIVFSSISNEDFLVLKSKIPSYDPTGTYWNYDSATSTAVLIIDDTSSWRSNVQSIEDALKVTSRPIPTEFFEEGGESLVILADPARDELTGYHFALDYKANNKSNTLKGNAEGGIVLTITLDSNSNVVVGGLSVRTDKNGEFTFQGTPSMSKITDGIIVLSGYYANEPAVVEAVQDPSSGKWGVNIDGFQGGKPFKTFLEITSLN